MLVLLLCGLPMMAVADAHLVVTGAWLREPPPGADVVAVYLKVRNAGAKAMSITGASSPLAGSVPLHESMTMNGMSHMQPLARMELPVGKDIEFKPGGRHIMLQNLTHRPRVGESVPLALLFADGTRLNVTARVLPLDGR
jgi:copper(I)-binding protein